MSFQEEVKRFLEAFQADVTFVDEAGALDALAEAIVGYGCFREQQIHCLSVFSPVLVDLLEAIKAKLGSISEESHFANASAFLAGCVRSYPHLKYNISVVLLFVKIEKGMKAATCLLNACLRKEEDSYAYMIALRYLVKYGCFGEIDESGIDLGVLLNIACTSGAGQGRMVYHAVRLIGEIMHLPPAYTQNIVRSRIGDEMCSAFMYEEGVDMAEHFNIRYKGCNNKMAGCIENGDGNSEEKESSSVLRFIEDRLYGQPTVRLGCYSLPTLRRASEGPWVTSMVSNATSMDNVGRLMQAVQASLPVIVQGDVGEYNIQ